MTQLGADGECTGIRAVERKMAMYFTAKSAKLKHEEREAKLRGRRSEGGRGGDGGF
jgi:hypothetical protein